MKITIRHGSAHAHGQPRAKAGVYALPHGAVVAIADGEGPRDCVAKAAERVLQYAEQLSKEPQLRSNHDAFERHLHELDKEIANSPEVAEVSMIIATVSNRGIVGYSVGDAKAWLLDEDVSSELTSGQLRAPLVGSGETLITPFALPATTGRILLCTQGLWDNAVEHQLLHIARSAQINQATRSLLALPRLPSGTLSADIALILCQMEPTE